MKILDFNVACGGGINVKLADKCENGEISVYTFSVNWTEDDAKQDASVTFDWYVPMKDFMYRWNPACHLDRHIGPSWAYFTSSMISANSPLECMYDGRGNNKYTWAISECANLLFFKSGVIEDNGDVMCRFYFNLGQFTGVTSTQISIRIDTRNIPMGKAIADVADWWATDCKMTPAVVPFDAKEPVYSFWYSFHQEVFAKDVEAECKRAKELGFNICIVDDGWQTGDNNRGYAYCGDWEVAPSKIPDMKKHVENVHKLGMKYVIWYSVPFMGYKSKNFETFKGMFLRNDDGMKAAVLDPRYKKVRDFLVNIYTTALREWDLDGFKLDFIDQWRPDSHNAPYNDKMDIAALPEAVNELMIEIMSSLKAIKPEILLEFRQSYIGPNMRRYGNMFRVGDCPNDYITNRVGIFDLRMLMGNTAVHSDMLMWHKDEKPETAALQIISVLYGVLQYSAKLDNTTNEIKQMSRFWIDFMKKHRALLLETDFTAYEPHLLYTWAKSTLGDECMIAVYGIDKCVKPDKTKVIYIANGCMSERVLVELDGRYKVVVQDCRGNAVSENERCFEGLSEIAVPVGGLITLTEI